MALNLVRNSKVFFTTNVDSNTGVLPFGGYGDKNTFELQVLDGFSFSQNTNSETITLGESGTTPVRGQRSFNTGLAPVDFSFSTYIRPKQASAGVAVTSEESVLWNALFSSKALFDPIKVGIGGGLAGQGTITSVAYTAGTGVITINGTSLPFAAVGTTTQVAVNEVVVITGLTVSTGLLAEQVNGYGTITAASGTAISITLNPFTNTATTITNTNTTPIYLTKQGVSQTTKIGSGGTGTITSALYSYAPGTSTSTGVGSVAVIGTSLPTYAAGDIVVLGGFTGTVTSTATVTNTPAADLKLFNQPAVVRTGSTTTSLILDVMTPFAGTVTLSPAYSSASSFTVTKSAWAENGTVYSQVSTASSDINQLQKFGMLFLVDNVMYGIDNCALGQASIDFSLDGIATIAWTGQGTSLKRMTNSLSNAGAPNLATATATAGSFGGTMIYGKYTARDTAAGYITNRLSTVVLKSSNLLRNKAGTQLAAVGETFNMPITGGNITINNNITYLTPELLNTVNVPSTYFQGTRGITGNFTAYLKTGSAQDTGELLEDLLAGSAANTEIMMGTTVNIGGVSALTPRVVLDMPATILTIPTIDVQQVVSTSINFTAEGSAQDSTAANVFDLTEENDLTIRYYLQTT